MAIAALNERFRTRRACVVVACGVFLFAATLFIARVAVRVGLQSPGTGDATDYDLLAMELAAGRGFRFDYDNPRWRSAYERAADDRYAAILSRHGASKTTFRPPLFPSMMAAIYSTVGRRFDVVRVVNCLFMAAAGGVTAWLVGRRLGPVPAVIFGLLFAAIEHRARFHAGLMITESSATFLVSLLVVLLARLGRVGGWGTSVLAGVVAGLAILDRSIFVLWMPLLVVLVWRIAANRRWRSVGLFVLAAILVMSPWAIRNSLLLGRFAPMGTHGWQNFAAAYSDEAIARGGVWFRLDEVGFFPPELDDSRPGVAREIARAELSRRAGIRWIRENPAGLIQLMAMRTWQLWRPRMHWDALILGLAGLGWLLWPDQREWRVFTAVLLANTLAVAATWSVGGRFLIPVLPVLHALAACAVWGAWGLVAAENRGWLRRWLVGRGER